MDVEVRNFAHLSLPRPDMTGVLLKVEDADLPAPNLIDVPCLLPNSMFAWGCGPRELEH